MRHLATFAAIGTVALGMGASGGRADDDDWRRGRGRDLYEERLKAEEKYWKEIRKAEEKRREQMLKAEERRWEEAQRARERERELAERAWERARERDGRTWESRYRDGYSYGERSRYDTGARFEDRSYTRGRAALDRYDYLPPPPPHVYYEERHYPPPARNYGPAYYGPEVRSSPYAERYYDDRAIEYYDPYDPYDPYASRGASAGASIGARIGGLIGGPEGAAIGAGIGRDIGAEVERR